jgi:signal transduction histidine kinase
MFRRARIRLTLLYIALFALVLGVFSVVFYVAFAIVLQPDFDITPELTNEQAAEVAYQASIARIALALVLADLVAVVVVGIAAWFLARRTIEPIRDAHMRQQRFVADASHEIRNPIAAIKSTAQGALRDGATADQMRTSLATVTRSADELARLSTDLLTLAQARDTVGETHRARTDLSEIAAETIESIRQSTPDAKIDATFSTDLAVNVDPDELGRVIRNLVDNGLRHSAADGVRVRTGATDRDAYVDVIDAGVGIATADLERIFEPFYRVHAGAGSPDGTGLGLAIAADLARRNGGRVTVASSPGNGSTFRLAVPRLR